MSANASTAAEFYAPPDVPEPYGEPPPDLAAKAPFGRKRGEPTPEDLLAGINKQMPFSDEAEKAVLSCLVQDSLERMPRAMNMLVANSFYHEANRAVWLHFVDRFQKNKPFDPVLVTNDLREMNMLERVGGPAAIMDLFTFVPSSAHFEHYLKQVNANFIRREVIRVCAEGVHASQTWGLQEHGGDASVVELVGGIESHIFSLVQRSKTMGESKVGPVPAVQGIHEWSDYMLRVAKSRGKVLGLSTGIHEIDANLHGIDDAEGEIFVIAARPGQGKTALGVSIVNHLALHAEGGKGVPGVVFSLEMSSNQLYTRLAMGAAGVDTSKIQTGHFSEKDKDAIATQVARIQASPLHVNADAMVSTADLRSQVQILARTQGIRWIMVDHLHLVKSANPKNALEERHRLVEVMETLQFLKKEFHLGVFLMVQMDRAKDKEHGKQPTLADLAGSAAIEWYADHVCFIHRPSYYVPWQRLSEDAQKAWCELVEPRRHRNPDNWSDGCKYTDDTGSWGRQDYEEDAILFIRKNRRGPTPEVHVRFEDSFTRFSSRMPKLNSDNFLDHQIGTWTVSSSGRSQSKPKTSTGTGTSKRPPSESINDIFPD